MAQLEEKLREVKKPIKIAGACVVSVNRSGGGQRKLILGSPPARVWLSVPQRRSGEAGEEEDIVSAGAGGG